jgi:DNA-binding transcriptional ArsR family regulator
MDAADPVRRPAGSAPAPPPGGWPSWFDPASDLLLTPRRLRGLVHPIRVRLLHLLETDGPATASQLGRRIGQSSGVTSYHLRILADLGFVEDDTERSNGRDRWWRTTYRSSAFSFRSPDDPGDPETIGVATQFMRLTVDTHHRRMTSFVDSLPDRLEELPTLPWTFSEISIELTHEQARALSAEVTAVVQRHLREPGRPPPDDGAVRAIFQFQMLPDGVPPDGEGTS